MVDVSSDNDSVDNTDIKKDTANDSPDRSSNLMRRLTLPMALEDGKVPGTVTMLLYIFSAFVLGFIIWASFTKIPERAQAPGELRPKGFVQPVQHSEGGQVNRILVSEGEHVERGQILINLRPDIALSDLSQLETRAASLSLQIARHDAVIEGTEPNFGDIGKKYKDLASDQLQLFYSDKAQYEKEREGLASKVEQRLLGVQTFHKQAESLERQVEIQAENLRMREELLKEGLVSRSAYLDARRADEKTREELIAMRGRLKSAQEALNESRSKLLELETQLNQKNVDERAKVSSELAELKESISKQKDRVTMLDVRSPISGTIHKLVAKSVGQVINPSETILEIVPDSDEKGVSNLIAEVQIRPQDIGHVRAGLEAEVKVTAFDSSRFGSLRGRVERISATTLQTEKGEPYYSADIILDEDSVTSFREKEQIITAGMVIQAEIITGKKSLAQYLLKPVHRSLSTAFSER